MPPLFITSFFVLLSITIHPSTSIKKTCDPSQHLEDTSELPPINFPPQVPDSIPLDQDELKWRNTTIRHLRLFANSFTDSIHHWLLDLGETCDPDIHREWTSKKDYRDFYHSDAWHGKVCTFTRFLHCNPSTSQCECAPKHIYGVDFQPALPEGADYSPTIPCLAKENEPCFIYLNSNSWPGQYFRMSVKFKCPQTERGKDHTTSTYSCALHTNKNSPFVIKHCHKCVINRLIHRSSEGKPFPSNLVLFLSLIVQFLFFYWIRY